jgi:hypothetical protein
VLSPQWRSALARIRTTKTPGRTLLFGAIGLAFWSAVFGISYRVLSYFRGVEEIGSLLAGKMLSMALLAFGGILLLSNLVAALSTFFLAKDLDMLIAAPIDWLRLYLAKLGEKVRHLKASGLEGVVYRDDGSPAAGVQVALLTFEHASGRVSSVGWPVPETTVTLTPSSDFDPGGPRCWKQHHGCDVDCHWILGLEICSRAWKESSGDGIHPLGARPRAGRWGWTCSRPAISRRSTRAATSPSRLTRSGPSMAAR